MAPIGRRVATKRIALAGAAAWAAPVVLSSPAAAQGSAPPPTGLLYGIELTGSQRLFSVVPATGVATAIGSGTTVGPGSVLSNPTGLAFNPNDGLVYGIERSGLLRIFSMAIGTGLATVLPTTDNALDLPWGLAWNPSDGQLYGTENNGANRVFRSSPVDGDAIAVGAGNPGLSNPTGFAHIP